MTLLGQYAGNPRDALALLLGRHDPGVDHNSGDLYRTNLSRLDCTTDLDPLTSGTLLTVAIPLLEGDVITTASFKSGATDIDTPTNQWVALYDPAGALLGQSGNLEDTDWPENTVQTFTFEDPITITETGIYRVGLLVTATTDMPSLIGKTVGVASASAAWFTGEAILAATNDTSLTTTAPSTLGASTAVATVPRVVLR